MFTQKIARQVHCVRKPPSDRPDRGQPAGDAEEQRKRLAALVQRERLHDDRERRGEHDRAAGALYGAEGDEPGLGEAAFRRQPAQRRGAGEDDARRASPSSGARRCRRAGRRRRRARRARAGTR